MTELEIYMVSADVMNDYISLHGNNTPGGIERERKRANVASAAGEIKSCMAGREDKKEDYPAVLFCLAQSDNMACPHRERMEALKQFIREYNFFNFAEGKGRKVLGCHYRSDRILEFGSDDAFEPREDEIPFLLDAGYHQIKQISAQVSELDLQIVKEKAILFPMALAMGILRVRMKEDRKHRIAKMEKEKIELKKIRDKILFFMETLEKDFVFFLDRKGEERPLREFFIW